MLSYRHAYHAGNAADVLKHVALCAILDAALAKPKPMLYLDTHAGSGSYDLTTEAARLNAEYRSGIGALWSKPTTDAPAAVARYLDCVRAENPRGALAVYPGSCAIAARLMAAPHRLIVNDLHPRDYEQLRKSFRGVRNVRCTQEDAYALLKSALPPEQSRAVTFVDPAYEMRDEPTRLLSGLHDAFGRFRHGVYVVWYPLTGKLDHARLLREFARLDPPKTLRLELNPGQDAIPGAGGSGLLVVNPPFAAIDPLTQALNYLARALASEGSSRCEWLVEE